MNTKWLLISVCCVALLLLAACGTKGSGQAEDLTDKFWALTELGGEPPLAGTGISAQFTDDGRVAGSAGCNRYSGSYTVSGKNITFSSPMAATMMMCDQAVMDQESAYLRALGEAKTFAIQGDQLTLSGEDGAALAVFQVQSQELSGSSWEATLFNNGKQAAVGLLEGTTLTASFGEDGSISGSAGCNNFSGSYTIDGNKITIGPLVSTMMMCDSPAEIMDQEAQYLAALQSAATYQIEGNVLELRTADDAIAAFFNRK